MTFRRIVLVISLLLSACGLQDAHLNLLLTSPGGLRAGDPVVLDNRVVGRVEALEQDSERGYVAKLAIESDHRNELNSGTRFLVARDPNASERRRVEIMPGKDGTEPLPEGATVRGSLEGEPLLPFGEILRGFGEGLNALRSQVERFRSDMQRLPDSDEAKQLRDQWTRLQQEMKQAQETTEESLKKEVLPKLREEMLELEKRFRQLEAPLRKDRTI